MVFAPLKITESHDNVQLTYVKGINALSSYSLFIPEERDAVKRKYSDRLYIPKMSQNSRVIFDLY